MAKRKRAKQKLLEDPVFEQSRVKAIDDAADNYFEVMQDRCKLSKEEDEKKTALIEVMTKHGLSRYETSDGLVVTVTAKSNVKVKRGESDGDEEGEE